MLQVDLTAGRADHCPSKESAIPLLNDIMTAARNASTLVDRLPKFSRSGEIDTYRSVRRRDCGGDLNGKTPEEIFLPESKSRRQRFLKVSGYGVGGAERQTSISCLGRSD
jgi:hypothetical protein